jgi:DNA-binding transcriptional MerR regulator
MPLFAPKKRGEGPGANIPVEEVLRLRQQGLSNNQIVEALQRNGFKSHQIFDAMNQADMRSGSPQPGYEYEEPPAFSEEEYEPLSFEQERPSTDDGRIEEIAEAIIDEKWQELKKDVMKIVDWKTAIEARLTSVEESLKSLKENFQQLQKGVLERVSDYDQSLSEVGTQIKAMENVFKQVLPKLSDNVNELSRIVKTAKGK